MRCPWCGSPVMIRGSSWECGWCGDSGSLKRTPLQQPEITLTLSFVYHVDLPETWNDLKKALGQLAPKNTLLSQLLGKVLLHNISTGIQNAGALPDEKKAKELRTFLNNTTDLNLGENAEEIMRDAKRGVLFREEAALSETDCGTFWTELLSTRPVEDYYNHVDPDGLFELFSELSSAYAYFGGKKDEEMGEAQDYRNVLEEAYNTHWQNKVLLHPDVERAKRLLAQGKFPDYEDICREILLVEYPEEVPHETAEDFDELSWNDILNGVFASNMAKGIQMWRRLLDIAEPSLKTDAETAEKLLPDWDWLDSPSHNQALLLLTALDDERFASQLFESASIGRLQYDVLNACRDCGQEKQGQHCLELALKNPYLEESWEKRFRRVFTTTPSSRIEKSHSHATAKPIADAKPDDGTVYHYCSVQVQGTRRPYAYLTGGLPLKVGDWVELPFGKDDVLRQGQIKAVMDCTRMVAPWPPEQTKAIIRVVEAPAEAEKQVLPSKPESPSELSPKPTQKKEPVLASTPKAATALKIPPASASTSPNMGSEMMQFPGKVEAGKGHKNGVPDEPEIIPATIPKRKFSRKFICCSITLFACIIAGVIFCRSIAAHYQQAERNLAENNFQSAVIELSRVPFFYRNQKSLSRYADLCLMAESGTKEDLKTALDGLESLLADSDEALNAQMQPQYESIYKQYYDLLYQAALDYLQNARFAQAVEYLQQIPPEYPCIVELQCYARAQTDVDNSDTSHHLKTVLSSLEQIPAEYDGPFSEDIVAFRADLLDMITDAETREEQAKAEREAAQAAAKKAEEDRIAALKASGIPYIGMAEREVNSTRQLGKAAYNDQNSGEWVKGADGKYFYDTKQVYAWYSKQNGDMVFKVECKNGVVISAVKYGGDTYWNGDQLLVKLGPQIIHKFNSGGTTNSGSDSSIRDEYDNPEDLYEENRDWFDDEDEAWDYWYED